MSRELIYWGNQYGNGIVISGGLAEKVLAACQITGETPEQFVMKAIDNAIRE